MIHSFIICWGTQILSSFSVLLESHNQFIFSYFNLLYYYYYTVYLVLYVSTIDVDLINCYIILCDCTMVIFNNNNLDGYLCLPLEVSLAIL